MKKIAVAVSAIVALLLVSGATAVLAHQGGGGSHKAFQTCGSYTVGETLPVSTLTGHYYNASNNVLLGTANGTFTFDVSQIYAKGCVLTIASGGTLLLNKTSYTITGGTVLLAQSGVIGSWWSRGNGPFSGNGLGTTSSGSFLFAISGLRGNSTKASASSIQLDLKSGTSEFLIKLSHWQTFRRR
jgi:hypothetical protein